MKVTHGYTADSKVWVTEHSDGTVSINSGLFSLRIPYAAAPDLSVAAMVAADKADELFMHRIQAMEADHVNAN